MSEKMDYLRPKVKVESIIHLAKMASVTDLLFSTAKVVIHERIRDSISDLEIGRRHLACYALNVAFEELKKLLTDAYIQSVPESLFKCDDNKECNAARTMLFPFVKQFNERLTYVKEN